MNRIWVPIEAASIPRSGMIHVDLYWVTEGDKILFCTQTSNLDSFSLDECIYPQANRDVNVTKHITDKLYPKSPPCLIHAVFMTSVVKWIKDNKVQIKELWK